MSLADLLESRLVSRPSRFLIEVELEGQVVHSHLPNPGRLKELLTPGVLVYLREARALGRKTSYDAVAVLFGSTVVSIDSRLPNRAIHRLLKKGRLREFREYSSITPEVPLGNSRVDFLLKDDHDCYLEVKSCTLVVENVALFPDAPTERGKRHLEELTQALDSGAKTAVAFVVQRPDADIFKPNDETDPGFGRALRRAHTAGVAVHAYRTMFDGVDLVDFEPIQTSLGVG